MGLGHYFTNPVVAAAFRQYTALKKYNLLAILEKLDRSQCLSPQELQALRLEPLRNLLRTAQEKSPFWKKRFKNIGLESGDIDTLESLDKIPVMTKRDIIEYRDEIVINSVNRDSLFENKSGGTTGSPLSYYLDQHKFDVADAATYRHNLWAGFKIGMKIALIWGAQRDIPQEKSWKARLKEKLWGQQIVLNCANISESSLQKFIADWKSFKPDILIGYAGGLNLFARYLNDSGIKINPPRAIIATAETLTAEMHRTVEAALNSKIYERYGCREVSVIASECEAHDGMHINAENLFLNYIPVGCDENGHKLERILITDLQNLVFPFINYQIGDIVVRRAEHNVCSCGRGLPKIQSVQGRVSDFIRTADGRLISGSGLTISLLSRARGILKTQMIQKSLENIKVRIVKDDNFDDKSIEVLKRELHGLLGDSMRLDFEFPEKIEREISGKYRLVISELTD